MVFGLMGPFWSLERTVYWSGRARTGFNILNLMRCWLPSNILLAPAARPNDLSKPSTSPPPIWPGWPDPPKTGPRTSPASTGFWASWASWLSFKREKRNNICLPKKYVRPPWGNYISFPLAIWQKTGQTGQTGPQCDGCWTSAWSDAGQVGTNRPTMRWMLDFCVAGWALGGVTWPGTCEWYLVD